MNLARLLRELFAVRRDGIEEEFSEHDCDPNRRCRICIRQQPEPHKDSPK